MHIDINTFPDDSLWDGELVSPIQTYGPSDQLSATIGRPFQWAENVLLGEKWQPPIGGSRFYLVQLAFTLRPGSRQTITEANFSLSLSPHPGKQAVVFDAYPREQLVEQSRPIKLGLGPELKFKDAEASVAGVETTLDFGYAIPVIRVEGLQESKLCWRYAAHAKHPLTGSRRMLAIIALPAGLTRTLATFALDATVETRFGLFRLTTPEDVHSKLHMVVGSAN